MSPSLNPYLIQRCKHLNILIIGMYNIRSSIEEDSKMLKTMVSKWEEFMKPLYYMYMFSKKWILNNKDSALSVE